MSTNAYYLANKEKCNAYAERYMQEHKEARAVYFKKWYADNRDRIAARGRKLREEKRALLDAVKSRPCADCGTQYPPYVMDFDHVRGKKIKTLGHLKGSIHVLKREIDKCEVVCANCHRERTHQRRQRHVT